MTRRCHAREPRKGRFRAIRRPDGTVITLDAPASWIRHERRCEYLLAKWSKSNAQ